MVKNIDLTPGLLKLAEFGITKSLGPASETVEIIISVEGIKK